MWQIVTNVTNMGRNKGNRLFHFFSAVKLQSSHVFTCRSHDRVHFMSSEISQRMYPIPSDILQSPFYVVKYITESILCCQIYHRVHFMLSTKHTTDNTVLKHHFHGQHSFEAPFPWTTQFWSTISMDNTVLKHHFYRQHSFEAPFPLTTQFQSTISTDDTELI